MYTVYLLVHVGCYKVKQPVVCNNCHVFCGSCMNLWLSHNSHCPACRVAITADNPCRPVIGQDILHVISESVTYTYSVLYGSLWFLAMCLAYVSVCSDTANFLYQDTAIYCARYYD